MDIIFFGSSDFSIPVLSSLHRSNHKIVCVVTIPPRKKGRGQRELPTVVQEWAESKSIKVLAPEKINTPEFEKLIRDLNPDCLVVASYGKMIPNHILELAKHYPLNVHPSLLPKYRGAAPIARQILNGETESGVTIARITAKLDAGEIMAQQTRKIGDDNSVSLSLQLAKLGGELTLKVLEQIEKKQTKLVAQDDTKSTYADKLSVTMGRVDWNQSADQILRQIRALVPWPCAVTYLDQLRIKILEAVGVTNEISKYPAGSIVEINSKGTVAVQAGDGMIHLKLLHPESGKAMNAYQFALGRHLKLGDRFV